MERRRRKASRVEFGPDQETQRDLRDEVTDDAVDASVEDHPYLPVPLPKPEPEVAEPAPDPPQPDSSAPTEDESPAFEEFPVLEAEPAEYEDIEDPADVAEHEEIVEPAEVVVETRPSHRQRAVAAFEARFKAPYVFSLPQADGSDETDPLSQAWAAMGDISEGETAIVRLDFRNYPEFPDEAQEWIDQMENGEEPKGTSKGAGVLGFIIRAVILAILAVIWFIRAIIFEATRNSSGGGKNSPEPPWRRTSKRSDGRPEVKPKLTEKQNAEKKWAKNKAEDPAHYEVKLRVAVVGQGYSDGEIHNLRRVAKGITSGFSTLRNQRQGLEWSETSGLDALLGLMPVQTEKSLVVSNDELATLAHFPDDHAFSHGLKIARSPIKPLVADLTPTVIDDHLHLKGGAIPLGVINKGSEDEQIVGMLNRRLDTHFACFGRSGTGKSELAKHMMFGIASDKYPLVFIDPHGSAANDLVDMLITYLPERLDDIVLIDIGDEAFPPAYNPLDIHSESQLNGAVEQVMEMARARGMGSSTPRAEQYCRQVLKALAITNYKSGLPPEHRLTILHVTTFLKDAVFRNLIMEYCRDEHELVEIFGPDTGDWNMLSEKDQRDYATVITRIFHSFTNTREFARVFATENKLDWSQLIKENKIVICNLKKQKGGSELVGEMIAQMLIPSLLGTMDSWGRLKDRRSGTTAGKGCRLIIDETPKVVREGSEIMNVLAEARKWDFGALLFGQFPDQLPEDVAKEIYANTASKICLKLGGKKTQANFNEEIGSTANPLSTDDIKDLPIYHAYCNVLIPSGNTGPFVVNTLEPAPITFDAQHNASLDRVIANSRRAIGVDAAVADRRLKGGTILIEGVKEFLIQERAKNVVDAYGQPNASDIETTDLALDQDDPEQPWDHTDPWNFDGE